MPRDKPTEKVQVYVGGIVVDFNPGDSKAMSASAATTYMFTRAELQDFWHGISTNDTIQEAFTELRLKLQKELIDIGDKRLTD